MYTTALSQIAFFPLPSNPFAASVMAGEVSNCLYQACEPSKPSSSSRKCPHPFLIRVSCSAPHTLQITLQTRWWNWAGSTSHPHRCTLPGHWDDFNHFFPGALSSRSIFTSQQKMWSLVTWTAGRQTFHCHSCYCGITLILMARKVKSRTFYTLLSAMGTSHMDVGGCPKTR